jgi:hypothetical protein
LAPLRQAEWVVYSKRPFGGPEAVLAYLSRYTHRVAIANSRLIGITNTSVTFKWKDYRASGAERAKVMALDTDEFIRRFLIHVLPDGLHRIRHYGLFANGGRAGNIARARQLLDVPTPQSAPTEADSGGDSGPQALSHPCPCCDGRTIIIETFERGSTPRYRPTVPIRIDPHERHRPVAKPEPRPPEPLPIDRPQPRSTRRRSYRPSQLLGCQPLACSSPEAVQTTGTVAEQPSLRSAQIGNPSREASRNSLNTARSPNPGVCRHIMEMACPR